MSWNGRSEARLIMQHRQAPKSSLLIFITTINSHIYLSSNGFELLSRLDSLKFEYLEVGRTLMATSALIAFSDAKSSAMHLRQLNAAWLAYRCIPSPVMLSHSLQSLDMQAYENLHSLDSKSLSVGCTQYWLRMHKSKSALGQGAVS